MKTLVGSEIPILYWTNKVRDQTVNARFLKDFDLLVKLNIYIIKVIYFVSFVHLRIETIVFAFNKTRLCQTTLKMKVV